LTTALITRSPPSYQCRYEVYVLRNIHLIRISRPARVCEGKARTPQVLPPQQPPRLNAFKQPPPPLPVLFEGFLFALPNGVNSRHHSSEARRASRCHSYCTRFFLLMPLIGYKGFMSPFHHLNMAIENVVLPPNHRWIPMTAVYRLRPPDRTIYRLPELIEARRHNLEIARSLPPGPQRNQHRQLAASIKSLMEDENWLDAHTVHSRQG
jgi:hypothetical protein